MGGMGFIENNKAECMLSVLINTNLLRAASINKCEKYLFSSSACVYNGSKQNETFIPGLKEVDAYPAEPEDGYGVIEEMQESQEKSQCERQASRSSFKRRRDS